MGYCCMGNIRFGNSCIMFNGDSECFTCTLVIGHVRYWSWRTSKRSTYYPYHVGLSYHFFSNVEVYLLSLYTGNTHTKSYISAYRSTYSSHYYRYYYRTVITVITIIRRKKEPHL